MKPWLETNPAIDEYADEGASGLYVAGRCVLGIQHTKMGNFWQYGLIVFNVGFGVWNDPLEKRNDGQREVENGK